MPSRSTNSNHRALPTLGSSRGGGGKGSSSSRSGKRPQRPTQSFYRSFAFVTPPSRPATSLNQTDRHIQYIDWPTPPRMSTPVGTSRHIRAADTSALGQTVSVHPAVEDVDNRFGIGIDIQSTSAVDLLMDDWLDRFEQEQWDFNSMAVYGEVKLLEAMKMTEQLSQPNDFVTALCCNLLGKLVPAFGPYVELMELLEEEIVRSIYYDYEKHKDRADSRQLFSAVTYDKKAKQYQQDIADLTKQREQFEKEHSEVVKDIKAKSFQVAQSVKQWHNQSLIASFRAWHAYVAFKKNNLAKTQKIFQRWVMSSSDLLRKVFHGWKIFRQKHQQENISRVEDLSREKFNEIQKTLVTLRERVTAGKAELERTTKQLADLTSTLTTKTAELKDAQERLAGSVDREAAVLEQAKTWAELARGSVQGAIDGLRDEYANACIYERSFPLIDMAFGGNDGGINQFANYWLTRNEGSDTISSVRHDMSPAIYARLLRQLELGIDAVEARVVAATSGGGGKEGGKKGKKESASKEPVLRDSDPDKEARLIADFAGHLLSRFRAVREQVHGGPSARLVEAAQNESAEAAAAEAEAEEEKAAAAAAAVDGDGGGEGGDGEDGGEAGEGEGAEEGGGDGGAAAPAPAPGGGGGKDGKKGGGSGGADPILDTLGDVPLLTTSVMVSETTEETAHMCFLAQLMAQSGSLCLAPWQPLPKGGVEGLANAPANGGMGAALGEADGGRGPNGALDKLQETWAALAASVKETPPDEPEGGAAGAASAKDKSKRKPLKHKKGGPGSQVDRITDVPQEVVKSLNAALADVKATLDAPVDAAEQRQSSRRAVLDVNTGACWEAAAAFANNKKKAEDGAAPQQEEAPPNPAVLKYGTLDRKRVTDLFDGWELKDPDAEWAALSAILVKRTALVKTAYVSCAAGGNATMDLKEFWKIVKQCKMPDKALTLAEIDLIFQKVNVEDADDTGGDNDANPDTELLPDEFLESLVRIAVEKYRDHCKTPTACVDALMLKNLKPNVSELNTSAFRKDLAQPQFKEVLKQNRDVIGKIFKKYTAADRSQGSSATMSMREWLGFVKDYKLVDARFSTRDATCVFSNCQDDGDEGGGGGDQQEMVYGEFVEALTASACYKVPDPFLTLELRMGQFMSEHIVPVYREKKRNG